MKDLPSRFSEAQFRRWETTIATAVSIAPARLTLYPRPDLSQETVSCRLRDAIRSLHENKWTTDKIELSEFEKLYPYMHVCRDGELVVVKHEVARAREVTQPTTLIIQHCSNEVLDACLVMRAEKLVQPMLFVNLTDTQKQRLQTAEQAGKIGTSTSVEGTLVV